MRSILLTIKRFVSCLPCCRIIITALAAAVVFSTIPREAMATTVQISWNPSSEQTLAGYRVHYGQASRSYSTVMEVTNANSASIGNLQAGKTYYFAASAYDAQGNESEYSNEVSYTVPSVNLQPVAQNRTLSVAEDTPASGTLGATNPDGKPLTFILVAPPAKGTVTITNSNTGAFTYSPNTDINGADTFSFKANDGVQDSNTASVSVNIAPVNDPPVARSDQGAATAGTPITINVLANDTDVDGDTLTLGSVTQGKNGSTKIVGGMVQYLQATNTPGMDSFTYTVSDGKGGTASAMVNIQILAANRPPVANSFSVSAKAGSAITGKLSATDPDGDSLRYSLVSSPSQGKATLTSATDGSFTYTANPGANGSDTMTFKANDGKADSNVATVTVSISGSGRIVFAVNSGGPKYVNSEGVVFEADHYFAGGNTYRAALAITDTEDDVLYQTERYGTFGYNVPIPNGHYLLTLKFSEIYWTAAKQRLFDIFVEGKEVSSNLDLFAAAGKGRAYDLKIPVRVTDGTLNLSFKADMDNAKLSGFLVQEIAEGFQWGVNAGGGRYVDAAGVVYEHDMLYSRGKAYGKGAQIVGTEDSPLYQTERFGQFSYDVPVPNGMYQVTLKLAEIYWNLPGKRVFDVKAEGEPILVGFDILEVAGMNEAYDYPIFVNVADGVLNLSFERKLDNAKVGAILIQNVP